MKYRKTALVEAEQFLPAEGKIPAGVYSSGLADPARSPEQWMLRTLEGEHTLRDGDYICTGPAGEKWNVAREIFEATYEPASAPPPPEQQVESGRLREAPQPIGEWHMVHGRWGLFFPGTALETSEQRIAFSASWNTPLMDAATSVVCAWAEGADLDAALNKLADVVSDSQPEALSPSPAQAEGGR